MLNKYSEFNIFRVHDVVIDIRKHIDEKLPFSLIRFGDGGIKLLHALYFNDNSQLLQISEREGIPFFKFIDIVEKWGYYARKANYIDTPEVYFTTKFWPKLKKQSKAASDETLTRMKMWRELYCNAEFDNCNFCSPEVNYLLILSGRTFSTNLLDIMKGKKIAIITACQEIKQDLKEAGYNVDIIPVCGQYSNHYRTYYNEIITTIRNTARKYDLWLVAAGEVGRIYSGYIKEMGGRSLDMGFVIDFWQSGQIPMRMRKFLTNDPSNRFQMKLTQFGEKYRNFI